MPEIKCCECDVYLNIEYEDLFQGDLSEPLGALIKEYGIDSVIAALKAWGKANLTSDQQLRLWGK